MPGRQYVVYKLIIGAAIKIRCVYNIPFFVIKFHIVINTFVIIPGELHLTGGILI